MSQTSDIAEHRRHVARGMLALSSWHESPPIYPSLTPEALQQRTHTKLTQPSVQLTRQLRVHGHRLACALSRAETAQPVSHLKDVGGQRVGGGDVEQVQAAPVAVRLLL